MENIIRDLIEASKEYLDYQSIGNAAKLNVSIEQVEKYLRERQENDVERKQEIDGFVKGLVYACARMIEDFDQPTMALHIFNNAGKFDESVASEYDLMFLRKHQPDIAEGKL